MKKRVISAAIMVALLILIFVLPKSISHIGIAVAVGLLAAQSYRELLGLKKARKDYPNYISVLGFKSKVIALKKSNKMEFNSFESTNPIILSYDSAVGMPPVICRKLFSQE